MTDHVYLVRKGGYFYRPNAQGYTNFKFDAGRYTKAEAEAHAAVEPWHMAAVHEDDVPDEREPDKFIAGLRAEIETLNQRWEYLCDDIGIESKSAYELTLKIWASIAKPVEDLQAAQAQISSLQAENEQLRAACNQSRLAFAGMVSVQSAIDVLDRPVPSGGGGVRS